jgi:hypothetical protein
MKKIFHSFLFFTFIVIFSPLAAETPASITTIKESTSRMNQVIGILEKHNVKLSETAFFFDFDETLATTVGVYQEHEFKLLTCPDRIRTYKEAFSAAFKGSEYNLDSFFLTAVVGKDCNYLNIRERYEFLDGDVLDLISKLKKESFFTGVCSALEANEDKYVFMSIAALEKNSFIFGGGGKPQAICGCLEKVKKPDVTISAIVLLDNSGEFAIKPFLEKMPKLVSALGFNNLKVIGIEFTKFSEMVNEEDIREELTLLDTLCQ